MRLYDSKITLNNVFYTSKLFSINVVLNHDRLTLIDICMINERPYTSYYSSYNNLERLAQSQKAKENGKENIHVHF